MSLKYRLGATASFLFFLSGLASAAPTEGFYDTLAIGGDFTPLIRPQDGPQFNAGTKFDIGPAGSVAGGWGWGNGFRTEIELGAFYNDVDSTGGISRSKGYLVQGTALFNILYDFEIPGAPVLFHVGAGVGADGEKVAYANIRTATAVDQSAVTLAYQGIAGVEYPVTDALKLGVEYRYKGTDNITYALPFGEAKYDIGTHAVMLTLRYDWYTPEPPPAPVPPPPAPVAPPPPAPAPLPEPQRSFQVFFDFDKSDITSAAAQVIVQAAQSVKAGNLTQITVTGHTDTVGSAKYNQGLSERRAAAVKKQLIADGVSGGEITTIGVGKKGLLVPTKDGVREPQNRRAEIVLQ